MRKGWRLEAGTLGSSMELCCSLYWEAFKFLGLIQLYSLSVESCYSRPIYYMWKGFILRVEVQ